MEKQFVAVNLRAQFVFLIRLVVTAVEETPAVFFPRRAGKFDPVEDILSIFPGLDVADFPLLPIGTGGGESIGKKFCVIAHFRAAQGNSAIFRERVWIEQLARLLGKIRRGVKNVLVLQPGIFGKEIAVLFLERQAEALVIPNFGEALLDSVALRDRFEKIERDFVFGFDPFP